MQHDPGAGPREHPGDRDVTAMVRMLRRPQGCRRWRLNFTDGAPVTVTRRGQPRSGTALLAAAAPGRVGAALRTALDNGAAPFELGLKIDKRHDPSIAELDAAGLSMIQFHFPRTEAR